MELASNTHTQKNFFGTYDKLHIIVPLIVIKMIIMLGSNGCIQYLNWDKLVSRRLYSLCVFLWLCVSHSPRFFLFLSRSRTGACVVQMSCVWYSLIPTVKKGALSLYVSLYCWNRTHCHPGGRSKNSNGKWQFSTIRSKTQSGKKLRAHQNGYHVDICFCSKQDYNPAQHKTITKNGSKKNPILPPLGCFESQLHKSKIILLPLARCCFFLLCSIHQCNSI